MRKKARVAGDQAEDVTRIRRRPGMTTLRRPYDLLERELQARSEGNRLERIDIVKRFSQTEGILQQSFSGSRPLPPGDIRPLAEILCQAGETPANAYNALARLNTPYAPRRSLLTGCLMAPLRIGYVPWRPFVIDPTSSEAGRRGVVVDLVTDLLARVRHTWVDLRLPTMLQALEEGDVDLIVGPMFPTPRRRAYSSFVPLGLPFSFGMNGVTTRAIAERLGAPGTYFDVISKLRLAQTDSTSHVGVIVGRGDTVEEILHAAFPGLKLDYVARENQTPLELIADRPKPSSWVVMSDDETCRFARLSHPELELLLARPVGQFRVGCLLPVLDNEFSTTFGDIMTTLISQQLPDIGRILNRYTLDLRNLLRGEAEVTEFVSWYQHYWPKEVPLDERWPEEVRRRIAPTVQV